MWSRSPLVTVVLPLERSRCVPRMRHQRWRKVAVLAKPQSPRDKIVQHTAGCECELLPRCVATIDLDGEPAPIFRGFAEIIGPRCRLLETGRAYIFPIKREIVAGLVAS